MFLQPCFNSKLKRLQQAVPHKISLIWYKTLLQFTAKLYNMNILRKIHIRCCYSLVSLWHHWSCRFLWWRWVLVSLSVTTFPLLSVSVRTSSPRCWTSWLQRTFVCLQRARMSWLVSDSLSEFSRHLHRLATFASSSVRDTSTSCWTSGSRSTGTTGRKVFVILTAPHCPVGDPAVSGFDFAVISLFTCFIIKQFCQAMQNKEICAAENISTAASNNLTQYQCEHVRVKDLSQISIHLVISPFSFPHIPKTFQLQSSLQQKERPFEMALLQILQNSPTKIMRSLTECFKWDLLSCPLHIRISHISHITLKLILTLTLCDLTKNRKSSIFRRPHLTLM